MGLQNRRDRHRAVHAIAPTPSLVPLHDILATRCVLIREAVLIFVALVFLH